MKLYVGNLSYRISDADLRSVFERYGQVDSARIILDKFTNRSKGFGFVEMPDSEAKSAMEALNGAELEGRNLTVSEARPRDERPSRY